MLTVFWSGYAAHVMVDYAELKGVWDRGHSAGCGAPFGPRPVAQ